MNELDRPDQTGAHPIAKKANYLVWRFRPRRFFISVFAVILFAVTGAACGRTPLRAEPESLERATPEVNQRLRADAFAYFRFVNRMWITRVCDTFGADLRDQSVVRLHGDARNRGKSQIVGIGLKSNISMAISALENKRDKNIGVSADRTCVGSCRSAERGYPPIYRSLLSRRIVRMLFVHVAAAIP